MATKFTKSNKFYCVKDPKIIYSQKILPQDLSSPMVINFEHFLNSNFLCDVPLKTKPEYPLI